MEQFNPESRRANIDLSDKNLAQGNIQFLRAEISSRSRSPFATVFYSIDGNEQEFFLRLDMDKQIFLDHFEDEREEIIHNKQMIIRIAEYIAKKRSEIFGM